MWPSPNFCHAETISQGKMDLSTSLQCLSRGIYSLEMTLTDMLRFFSFNSSSRTRSVQLVLVWDSALEMLRSHSITDTDSHTDTGDRQILQRSSIQLLWWRLNTVKTNCNNELSGIGVKSCIESKSYLSNQSLEKQIARQMYYKQL